MTFYWDCSALLYKIKEKGNRLLKKICIFAEKYDKLMIKVYLRNFRLIKKQANRFPGTPNEFVLVDIYNLNNNLIERDWPIFHENVVINVRNGLFKNYQKEFEGCYETVNLEQDSFNSIRVFVIFKRDNETNEYVPCWGTPYQRACWKYDNGLVSER